MNLSLKPMKTKIYDYIKKNNMLDCANLIVGLSGGADSMCLVSILKDYIDKTHLGINMIAVHVNHGIRQEAIDDEKFVSDFCKKNNIPLKIYRIDCLGFANKYGMTVEEAGRKERYRIFNELAKIFPDARIAVAHHMNDQAETVLMNLSRGTDISGLRGIRPVRDNIIRPLLCVTKQDIYSYLKDNNISYVVDATNFDNDYTRNAIRNIIIPELQDKVNGNVIENISSLASKVLLVEDFLAKTTESVYKNIVSKRGDSLYLDITNLQKCHNVIADNIIYKCLVEMAAARKDIYGIHVESVEDLMSKDTGKSVNLPYNLVAKRKYDYIVIEKNRQDVTNIEREEFRLNVDLSQIKDEYVIKTELKFYYNGEIRKASGINFKLIDNKVSIKEIDSDFAKCFDYAKIKPRIDVRYRKMGDYLTVDSYGHSHKLKSEFINRKIENQFRDKCLLICQEDECLWAVGVRRSQTAMVDLNTDKILIVTLLVEES